MKYLVLIAMLFALPFSSQAGHLIGGEITWECLNNGSFVFKMHVYADFQSSISFNNELIQVSGTPLPTSGGSPITTILVKPNLTAYNLTPSNYYVYESDPISLNGTPPPSGWSFSYNLGCCIVGRTNFSGGGNGLLKATMFPSATNTLTGGCYDSSPQFMEMPKIAFSPSINYITQNIAVDFDGDSLVHRLDRPLSGTGANTTRKSFNNGYSFANYTGNGNAGGNVPYTIDAKTGNTGFSYQSTQPSGTFNREITVDAYRAGVKIATVNRAMIFYMLNSTVIPNEPQFNPNLTFDSFGIHYDTLRVGSSLTLPIRLIDTANAGDTLTLVPFGSSFSADFFRTTNCQNPNDTSCAVMFPSPNITTSVYPSRYELLGVDSINTTFYYIPTCDNLNLNGTAKTHYFTFGYEVNNRSDPQFYRTLAITVEPDPVLCNTITSLASNETQLNDIRLFPNPTNGRFQLTSSGDLTTAEVNIRNVKGQLVKRVQLSNSPSLEIEIPGSAGLYFVEVLSQNGDRQNLKVLKR